MAGADAVKQLKIKTSAVSRLMKDRVASDREIEGQKERIGKVRSDPEKDEHDVAKQARRPRRVAQRRTAADAEPPARPPVRRRRRCSPRWWPAGQTSCAGSRTLRSSSTLSWRAAGEPRRGGARLSPATPRPPPQELTKADLSSSEEHANAADVFGQAAAILKREGVELDD